VKEARNNPINATFWSFDGSVAIVNVISSSLLGISYDTFLPITGHRLL
jgi:hypothetical protein